MLMQSGGHIMQGLAIVIQSIIFFFIIILVAWFFLMLVNPALNNPIVRIIHVLAEPLIAPIQRYIPRTSIDFSPLICMLLFIIMQMFLVGPINHFGGRLSYPIKLCIYWKENDSDWDSYRWNCCIGWYKLQSWLSVWDQGRYKNVE